MGLERFVDAQDRGATFETALAEIRAGAKTSHWIWFVFPQLAGLGTSPTSRVYALADRDEAERYLRHPLLGQRLVTITTAVLEQLRAGRRLDALMGSAIDAAKLVSSMTLFAGASDAIEPDTPGAPMAALAHEALAIATAQGFRPCAFTTSRLRT
jgi:uncharacterized protein (DUF1810 family)